MKYRPFNPALIRIFYDVKLRTGFFLFYFFFLRITCTYLGSNGSAALDIKNKNSTLFFLSLSLVQSRHVLEHSIFQALSNAVHSRKYISHHESVQVDGHIHARARARARALVTKISRKRIYFCYM
jgi:hypothetical protein